LIHRAGIAVKDPRKVIETCQNRPADEPILRTKMTFTAKNQAGLDDDDRFSPCREVLAQNSPSLE
jgi:hypothetical protein